MPRRALVLSLLLAAGCRPDYLSSVPPRPELAELRAAADRLAAALADGSPEADDGALFSGLVAAAERCRARGADDAALAAFAAAALSEAGTRFADDAARAAARARALRGARRWVLPAHPEAARYLR